MRVHDQKFMKSGFRVGLVALAMGGMTLVGCDNAGQGAVSGATAGALGGLVIGSLTGSAGKGAAIGAVAGGVGGAVVGDQNARKDRRARENQRYDY